MHTSTTRMPAVEPTALHPRWCSLDACTAYSLTDADVDARYHRSRPLVVETEDPFVVLYAHLLAPVDGSGVEVEISELERPFTRPWYDLEPVRGRQLVMPLERAESLRHVLASLVRAGRG
jgi:hypothetical protein